MRKSCPTLQWPPLSLHALYQNYLYKSGNKRRVMLHRSREQLARHYGARTPHCQKLAMHFERGRDFARAVEYLIHAGDNAAKLYGYAEAEKHYTHALSLVEKLPDEVQTEKLLTLYQKRGTVNHALSKFPQAVDDFTGMLDQARALNSLELQSAALNAMTMTLFFSHRLEETLARASEALEVAEQAGSEKLRIETMLLIGLKHLCYGEVHLAKVVLDDVEDGNQAESRSCARRGWRRACHTSFNPNMNSQ